MATEKTAPKRASRKSEALILCNICECPIGADVGETCAECEAGIAECERPFEQEHAPS